MDWISFTATATSQLILAAERGEELAPLVAKHNLDFARSYHRWFQAFIRISMSI